MKNTVLKFWLSLTVVLAMTVSYSCKKDDDGNGNTFKITAANIVNSPAQVAVVKALAYWGDDSSGGYDTIAQAPYSNNGFTLGLPATLSDKYLEQPYFDEDDMEGVTISDKNVKLFTFEDIEGYNESGHYTGSFYLAGTNEDNEDTYYSFWIYVDRNVTINGEAEGREEDEEGDVYTYTEKIDLNLKRGWNAVYISSIESYDDTTEEIVYTDTFTSQKTPGVNYLWHFYGYDDDKPAPSVKFAASQKSFFTKLK